MTGYFMLHVIIGSILGLFALGLTFSMLYCLSGGADIPYHHMSYDKEIEWLTKTCGLTKEEAEDIANIPWS